MARILPVLLAVAILAFAGTGPAPAATTPNNVYTTYGVHSDANAKYCKYPDCVFKRAPGEPSDPSYPAYWSSHWVMYRVFNKYQDYPPPYAGKPPAALKDGEDYQTSWGETFYDTTWTFGSGKGAMEEHYDKFCLPIFQIPNNYSCSFISLGETAYFVTYDDRPSWMPPVCLFSPRNHPPEQDFIKHLPYSGKDSGRIPGIQAYSFWVTLVGNYVQTGVVPDQTSNKDILFGYAFDATPTPDRVDKSVPPYRHPQSFFFSGVPTPVPNAPIVSQNYTDFAMVHPDPAKTWAQVAGLDPKTLPECQLFKPPPWVQQQQGGGPALLKSGGAGAPPTWGDIGKPRR